MTGLLGPLFRSGTGSNPGIILAAVRRLFFRPPTPQFTGNVVSPEFHPNGPPDEYFRLEASAACALREIFTNATRKAVRIAIGVGSSYIPGMPVVEYCTCTMSRSRSASVEALPWLEDTEIGRRRSISSPSTCTSKLPSARLARVQWKSLSRP